MNDLSGCIHLLHRDLTESGNLSHRTKGHGRTNCLAAQTADDAGGDLQISDLYCIHCNLPPNLIILGPFVLSARAALDRTLPCRCKTHILYPGRHKLLQRLSQQGHKFGINVNLHVATFFPVWSSCQTEEFFPQRMMNRPLLPASVGSYGHRSQFCAVLL